MRVLAQVSPSISVKKMWKSVIRRFIHIIFEFCLLNSLSPLLFNFSLEYAVREVQETRLGLDMNDTHQEIVYADDKNLIGDDIRTIERNADVLLNAC